MAFTEPTDRDLRATFTRVLARIRAGEIGACPSDTGLDPETQAALDDYGAGRITANDARAEFARMLDGTHAHQTRQRYANLR